MAAAKVDGDADFVRALAERQGLGRALEHDPDTVRDAAARALRPLAPLPAGMATTEPAFGFDPLPAAGAREG